MIHTREDYMRIQDPENKIGEDEPVLLIRAKDAHYVKVLQYYLDRLELVGNLEVAKAIQNNINLAKIWRAKKENEVREPDL